MKKLSVLCVAFAVAASCLLLGACEGNGGNGGGESDPPKPTYTYPEWLGTSEGATTTVSSTNKLTVRPGEKGEYSTAPKWTASEDGTLVTMEPTSLSLQLVANEGGSINLDENCKANTPSSAYVYVDVSLTGDQSIIEDETAGNYMPASKRMFLRLFKYGDGSNTNLYNQGNYYLNLWYDNFSLVNFSTTDENFESQDSYRWMQDVISGKKVYLNYTVSYGLTLDEETNAMLFKDMNVTMYFGFPDDTKEGGVRWSDSTTFYDPVNGGIIDGKNAANGDALDLDVVGNTMTWSRFAYNGYKVSESVIHVSPNAKFSAVCDYVAFGKVI